jgi:hypothetical protein
MDHPRSYIGQFKQYAFVWKPEFGQRQTDIYRSENGRYIEDFPGPDITKEDVIDMFVNVKCRRDIDRHMYRKRLLTGFLETADIKILTGPQETRDLKSMVFLDDRNDAGGSRDNRSGHFRQHQNPLNVRQFYNELSQPVYSEISFVLSEC